MEARNMFIKIILSLWMCVTLFFTFKNYYTDFTLHSPYDFERYRMMGHEEFSAWLQANTDPKDTTVILGDPINCNAWQLMFYNYKKPYRFQYLNGKFIHGVYELPATWDFAGMKPDFTYSYNGHKMINGFLIKK